MIAALYRDVADLVRRQSGPLSQLDATERNARLQDALPKLHAARGYAGHARKLLAELDDKLVFGAPAELSPQTLRNTYYLGRHGESLANLRGIISCGPKAFRDHGLSPLGLAQATASSTALVDQLRGARIIASPLARASMTAAVHAGVVGALSLRHDIRLRERDFGALEGKANTHYDAVWASDATTPHAKPHGAETTRDVRDRVLSLISDLERDHAGETFVLVSHGDTAQITETWFKGIAPHAHRSLTPMQTGELRKVT